MPPTYGGSIAISGYLYQLLAVTGVQVSAGPDQKKAPDKDALITVHEWLDEDGSLLSPEEKIVTFVQVKYAEKGEGEPIKPGELKEIVHRLFLATDVAMEKGWTLGGYFLISNRGLSVDATTIVKELSEGKNTPWIGQSPPKRKKGEKKTIAAIPWSEEHEKIASWLIDFLWKQDEVIEQIRQFANSYGVLPHEFDEGISRLIKEIFTGVASLREKGLTRKDLVKLFAGDRDAIPLLRASQAANQALELKAVNPSQVRHIQRDCTIRLLDRFPQHSIFVFHGKGGSGKTASLRELAAQLIAPEAGPLLRGTKAVYAGANWASGCADVWRNISPPSEETKIARAIERLKTAKQVPPPILLIALDGIDEKIGDETKKEIRKLINYLLSAADSVGLQGASDVKLFVTCRELSEFEEFLPRDPDNFEEADAASFKDIRFDDFNRREFREIVLLEAHGFADRLIPSVSISEVGSSLNELDSKGIASTPEAFLYLQDPLIWKCFANLAPEVKKALLDGNDSAAVALGASLFRRFANKAMLHDDTWKRPILLSIMKAVVFKVDKTPSPWTRDHWCTAGSATGVRGYSECGDIFREALLGGLIDGGPADWSWRNRAIPLFITDAND